MDEMGPELLRPWVWSASKRKYQGGHLKLGSRNFVQRVTDHDVLDRTIGHKQELQVFLSGLVVIPGTPQDPSLDPLVRIQVFHFMEVLPLAASKTSGKLTNGSTKPELALMWLARSCQGSGLPPSQIIYFNLWEIGTGLGLRERYWFTWKYIERTACNQECKQREVECDVCGLQSEDCNGLYKTFRN